MRRGEPRRSRIDTGERGRRIGRLARGGGPRRSRIDTGRKSRLNARIPAPAYVPAPLPEFSSRRVARNALPFLLPLLLLAGLIFLLVWACDDDGSPDLTNGRFEGPRTLAGPACIALVSDVSGSMKGWQDERAAALDQLREFSRKNLRPDDRLAVFTFDDDAAVSMPPTKIQALTNNPISEHSPGSGGTIFGPAVDKIRNAFAGEPCTATGVAVISDGEIHDSPTYLSSQLQSAGFTRLWFIIPGGDPRPAELSHLALSGIVDRHFDDARSLGASYGQLLADITGHHFVSG